MSTFKCPTLIKLNEFHLFPNFPKEIRDRIWEHAWPSPGIHFLRLFDPWRHRLKNKIIQGPSWDMNFSLVHHGMNPYSAWTGRRGTFPCTASAAR